MAPDLDSWGAKQPEPGRGRIEWYLYQTHYNKCLLVHSSTWFSILKGGLPEASGGAYCGRGVIGLDCGCLDLFRSVCIKPAWFCLLHRAYEIMLALLHDMVRTKVKYRFPQDALLYARCIEVCWLVRDLLSLGFFFWILWTGKKGWMLNCTIMNACPSIPLMLF